MKKILVFVVIALFWVGGSNVWNGLVHSSPTAVTLGEVKPTDFPSHIELKNVSLSLLKAVSGTEFGANVVFLPAQPKNTSTPGRIQVLVRTNDREVIAVASEKSEDPSQRLKQLALLYPKIQAHSEIIGMTDSTLPEKKRDQLKKLMPELADDFVVIREGQHPSIIMGIVFLGLAIAAILLVGKFTDQKNPPQAPPVLNSQPPRLPSTRP